jgi:hypothetical protein
VLEVTFVRRRGQRDRVYVARDDGTTTGWDFPSYGDGLPHDLCHLVVEAELGLTEGFWGLVDQGVEVGLVHNQATLLRGGRPLADQSGVDLSGLLEAEAAVNSIGSPMASLDGVDPAVALPATATPEAVEQIGRRLAELGDRWRTLADGGSIRLTFPTST